MEVGAIVGERFTVEARVAAGGMGVVLRARDHHSGAPVALKLLHLADPEALRRFALEARILEDMRHAHIVRHIADGLLPNGQPWLAMEWLDGETLSARLRRGQLRPAEAAGLGARLADALAAAHARGVVHRDLKPSNVFLVGGALDDPRLLDFGVAQLVGAERFTRADAAVGTPAYMSPEQARGGAVDPRADLFSLGCVLYECLTGTPPFAAHSTVAVLAKILFMDSPLLSTPGVPPALRALVDELLEKDRSRRPADAGLVAARLRTVAASTDTTGAAPAAITGSENRLVCVALARRAAELPPLAAGAIARLAHDHQARLEGLVDGSMVVVLAGAGAAVDLVARGARCALGLRALLPDAQLALATGRAVLSEALPVGDVIERAAALAGRAADAVRLDDLSARLLDAGFQLARDGDEVVLRGERPAAMAETRLFGRPTPFVGRDRQLAVLEDTLAASMEEPSGRAALVVAPAGMGKSRLVAELLLRPAARAAEVWVARGDPVRKGSPFALAAQALRGSAGILDGDPPAEARRKLRARAEDARVADFLCEIAGAPVPPDEAGAQLFAARGSPLLMVDQIRRAWEDFLTAECARRPVVMVLEDLHWGDVSTVKLVDGALRNLAERPLLVIALARPEIDDAFPRLWEGRNLLRLHLQALPRKAAETLVRAALGQDAAADRIVEYAAGNAFYLEQLIRAVAEGSRDDELPETVLAMAQSRLESLPEASRRVLRAASVFGQSFLPAGVAALLGDGGLAEVAAGLPALLDAEVVAGRRDSEGLAFRHSLLREAAYAMLTQRDRSLGHRLAGEWLEGVGTADAAALAWHFEQGGERGRAAVQYRRAAEQALEGNDLEAVLWRSARAAALGAEGAARAALRLLEATAHHWRAEYEEGERCATDAMRDLDPFTPSWYRAAEEIAETAMPLGRIDHLNILAEALHPPPGGGESSAAFVVAGATLAMQLSLAGRPESSARVMERVERAAGRLVRPAPQVRARVHFARAMRAVVLGDMGALLAEAQAATLAYDEAGNLRDAALMRTNLAGAYLELGGYAEAEPPLREALAAAERLGLQAVVGYAKENLGMSLARRGARDEAIPLMRDAIAVFAEIGDPRNEGLARIYLATLLSDGGDPAAGAEEARRAAAVAAGVAPVAAYAQATLSTALLQTGEREAALAASSAAAGTLDGLPGIEEGEALVRLAHARALAAGGRDEARAVLAAARTRLLERATKISDEAWRASFLGRVAENAEILRLAEEWKV